MCLLIHTNVCLNLIRCWKQDTWNHHCQCDLVCSEYSVNVSAETVYCQCWITKTSALQFTAFIALTPTRHLIMLLTRIIIFSLKGWLNKSPKGYTLFLQRNNYIWAIREFQPNSSNILVPVSHCPSCSSCAPQHRLWLGALLFLWVRGHRRHHIFQVPAVLELEAAMHQLLRQRASRLVQRRQDDIKDESSEFASLSSQSILKVFMIYLNGLVSSLCACVCALAVHILVTHNPPFMFSPHGYDWGWSRCGLSEHVRTWELFSWRSRLVSQSAGWLSLSSSNESLSKDKEWSVSDLSSVTFTVTVGSCSQVSD